MSRCWVVVSGPEIFGKTREMGFTRHGFKSTRRGMAAKIGPGDRLAFYVTGAKSFAATATVTSDIVEEYDRIWRSDKKPGEMYPYRVQIRPDVVLEADEWVEAESLHDQFTWTQRWPRANWTLAYQGNLHEVSEADFALLEAEMRSARMPPRGSAERSPDPKPNSLPKLIARE